MKVYAVVERCRDSFYSDYIIIDECVYLKEEDAQKRLNEIIEKKTYLSDYVEVYDFEVKE